MRSSEPATPVWNPHPKRALASNHPVPWSKGQEFRHMLWEKMLSANPSWLRILKQIARGLSHIHQHGILHNDLKANNVVLEKRKEHHTVIIYFRPKASYVFIGVFPSGFSEVIPPHRSRNCLWERHPKCGFGHFFL